MADETTMSGIETADINTWSWIHQSTLPVVTVQNETFKIRTHKLL